MPGKKRDYGQCRRRLMGGRRCQRLKHKADARWCAECTKNLKRQVKRKRTPKPALPTLVRTRVKAYDDIASPDIRMPPAYPANVTSVWWDWFFNPDNLCDEEALRRWEDRLGLGHDVPLMWDQTFGTGQRPKRQSYQNRYE